MRTRLHVMWRASLGAVLALCISSPALAATPNSDPVLPLQALYERAKSTLDNPGPENPFYLQANHTDENDSGEAAVYLPLSLKDIASALGTLSNWCDILPLHINVKTCTYNLAGNQMTLYMGRKHYQAPDAAFELVYRFHTISTDNYFAAIAHADEGPLSTTDYQIKLEFTNIGGKTFGRIYVANHQSWISRKGMEVYLSTLGKDKEGIRVIDHDAQGKPIYSSGAEGVAERNLVRYYLAFTTFFKRGPETDAEKRYEAQLRDWFARTEKFPQLYEMSKSEYLDSKHRERRNQLALQKGITAQ
jgi:hypothetical protein